MNDKKPPLLSQWGFKFNLTTYGSFSYRSAVPTVRLPKNYTFTWRNIHTVAWFYIEGFIETWNVTWRAHRTVLARRMWATSKLLTHGVVTEFNFPNLRPA